MNKIQIFHFLLISDISFDAQHVIMTSNIEFQSFQTGAISDRYWVKLLEAFHYTLYHFNFFRPIL